MNIGYQDKEEDIVDALSRMLEQETGQKIFTLRVIDNQEKEESEVIETLVVFENKSILNAFISIQTIEGKLAARMQGNYI